MIMMALVLAASTGIGPAQPPQPLNKEEWFRAEDYPHAAREEGAGGAVGFSLLVDTGGSASDCRIERSSGVSALDAATCELATARARFAPARDASGRSVAARYDGNIKWTLQPWQPLPLEAWSHVINTAVSSAGTVLSCTSDRKGTVPDRLGLKCPELASSAGPQPAGNASGPAITVAIQFMVSVDGEVSYPAKHQERGRRLIGLIVERFDVSDQGKAENCRVVERRGDAPADPGFCRYLLGPYHSRGSDAEGTKRRSGTILWARSVLMPDADGATGQSRQ